MNSNLPYRRWHISEEVLEMAQLPKHLEEFLGGIPDGRIGDTDQELVVTTAEEAILGHLPKWVGVDTRYLIVADVPEPALLRLPTVLGLHKPDRRLHVTRDLAAVKRMVISLGRDRSWEGIVDSYVLCNRLVVVLGDFRIPEFPKGQLPQLKDVDEKVLGEFTIDSSGSYLYWPSLDLHLGPSQLFQAVDPMFLADVAIERYADSKVSLALLNIREAEGLRQGDITELSERQVRRLEKEESKLTVEAAQNYAATLECSLSDFLDRLSREIAELRDDAEDHSETTEVDRVPASTSDNKAGYGSGAHFGAPPPNPRRKNSAEGIQRKDPASGS